MKKLFALLALCSSIWGASVQCDTLYILQDAGETIALKFVLEQAEKNQDDYRIFANGTAAALLDFDFKSRMLPINLEEKLDRDWKRSAALSEKSVQTVLDHVHAKKVVSGVAFEFQGQLLTAFEKQGAKSYAYWDNININGTDAYFETAKKVAACAQTLLAPSHAFLKVYPEAQIVGQPVLEASASPLAALTTDLPLQHPLIVWIGGYGDDYNEALKAFLEGASVFKDAMIVLSYHPKYEGIVEKEMLEKYHPSNVVIYDAKKLSSAQAIAHSDFVICHQSTAGLQAALGGKKVFYFTPQGQSYTNLLIENKITPQVSTTLELNEAMKNSSATSKDILDVLQVPRHGTKRLYNTLHGK